METIKSYLEAMFANMPNTPEVKKAKDELLTMMEDKYNEMIADGVNENTAVGTVISEFGFLLLLDFCSSGLRSVLMVVRGGSGVLRSVEILLCWFCTFPSLPS